MPFLSLHIAKALGLPLVTMRDGWAPPSAPICPHLLTNTCKKTKRKEGVKREKRYCREHLYT